MAESKITDLSANVALDSMNIVSVQGYPTSIANGTFQTIVSTGSAPLATNVYPNSPPTGSYPPYQQTTAGGTNPTFGGIPIMDGAISIPQLGIPVVRYKFNESAILDKAKAYIDSTYAGHYSEKDGIQALDFIMANSESYDFLKGNVLKYTARYGKKEGHNPKDILKAIHYLIILYYFSLEKK